MSWFRVCVTLLLPARPMSPMCLKWLWVKEKEMESLIRSGGYRGCVYHTESWVEPQVKSVSRLFVASNPQDGFTYCKILLKFVIVD